jgi:hypothetical protein
MIVSVRQACDATLGSLSHDAASSSRWKPDRPQLTMFSVDSAGATGMESVPHRQNQRRLAEAVTQILTALQTMKQGEQEDAPARIGGTKTTRNFVCLLQATTRGIKKL